MKHVRFLRLLMMTCLIMLTTGAWAQKTYNSFANFFANTPDEEEAIVNFNNVQVIHKEDWAVVDYGVYIFYLKDETTAIRFETPTNEPWQVGDILNGKMHVIGYYEDPWGYLYVNPVQNDDNYIQISGTEEVVPLEIEFSDLSKDYCNQIVRLRAAAVDIDLNPSKITSDSPTYNESPLNTSWCLTDGDKFCLWEGDASAIKYYTSSQIQPQIYNEFETIEDCADAFEDNQIVRRGVECVGLIDKWTRDEGEEYLRIRPLEILDVYDYVPVTFKQKFEGFTSFHWDAYAGVDHSFWGGNSNRFFVFQVPEGVKAFSCSVEDGYIKRTLIADNHALNGYNSYLLEMKDKTFADGDVTVQLKGSWANPWDYYPIEGNMLYGNNTEEETNVGGDTENYKFYRLTLNANQDKGSIGFYWGAEDGGPFTVSAHKAFLAVPREVASSAAMPFDGTTRLAGVKTVQSENSEIYSISGVKMKGDNLPKGIYVTNGKKMVIK